MIRSATELARAAMRTDEVENQRSFSDTKAIVEGDSEGYRTRKACGRERKLLI